MFDSVNFTQLFYIILSLLISMVVHEYVHASVGYMLGDHTARREGRLTLNPMAHIDVITTILLPSVLLLLGLPPILAARPVPFNPYAVKFGDYGAALIAIAGPLSNFVMAIMAGLLLSYGGVSSFVGDFLVVFCYLNVGLFIFNLIPIPPLDGSRVLYAVAPDNIRSVMESFESLGLVPILMIFMLALQFIGPALQHINEAVLTFILGL